ncbi:taste receptor type 1 member 1-like [Nothobranchius furzeri]|uniref:Taste receptor type 1 member 1-like n=1 Tax=Nothobranchius furzeri TaxID=105023 RepID=A0A8C6Q2L9_NOTFU|nr:taste receptor type 1 member 1-like [Nothobranchius furzeri]
MKHVLPSLFLLGIFLHASFQCTTPSSEFHQDGDFFIGGLFEIHHVSDPVWHMRPDALDCSSQPFSISNYRRFQLMRFAVEQINNSTSLLPNVTLGYEMFDHCSDMLSFPNIFKLISANGLIHPWYEGYKDLPKVIAVVGPLTSTQALIVAPLFMADLIPMVGYGSTTSVFSNKVKYPSYLRTVHPNRDIIEVIFSILKHFNWRWVAFLNSDDDCGIDGLGLFIERIKSSEICMAYTNDLSASTNYSQILRQIERQKIHVIIVFAPEVDAEALIESAIQLKVTNKVWIANDEWSLNKRLPKMKGIRNIGTVLGVAQPVVTIPGFGGFIHSFKRQIPCENDSQQFCNQVCNCSDGNATAILNADPSFSFPVYSAVYAIAHALHNTLQCEENGCRNVTVYPNMVLAELQKSNFTLLNRTIQFDENGNLKFGSYSLVYWNHSGDAQKIGSFRFFPTVNLSINSSEILWFTNGTVPVSLCSLECSTGYVRKQNANHRCCFSCEICPNGTYINVTEDPFNCISCEKTEWSAEGSTSCNLRLVEFVPLTDGCAVVIMVGACILVALTLFVSVLFAINYNTPVVRSAGGPMCFLILGCLNLCSLCVFFYFGEPTDASCFLRYFPFFLFYTVCLACFFVRSFQIVFIFKISAQFPKLLSWWTKYQGQWLLITAAFTTQALLLIISFSYDPPRPYNETLWYQEQIVLFCYLNLEATSCSFILLALLGLLCFIFSYMGKDLPKNYNEAKAITFCLLLLIVTWIMFVTVYLLYHGKHIQTLNALAVLSSLYLYLLWYFLPKCYIILFQPHKNTQQYFQGLIQNYTKTVSQ